MLWVDSLVNIDCSSWHTSSNMYTPFFAGIVAVYATHRDKKTSVKQARIKSIGSIIGGYFGMGIVYLIEYLFIELLIKQLKKPKENIIKMMYKHHFFLIKILFLKVR